ncbi:MAG TPA: CheR family methyltransferase [Mycobacteriales bacterium]|nr:CheR family methyltransferase [Mycobacteriales bacterium]
MRNRPGPLTDQQFSTARTLLARAAGLVFDESRRDSLTYSLAERLRETGVGDVETYLALVSTDAQERQRLLDEVTIQETHFFRNPPQIRALRTHVLPELVRHASTHGRRLRIWSAGCSTGEEPYTIAMALRELLPSTVGWDVKVLATDVSERALTAARAARYGARAVALATPEDLERFFAPLGNATWEVRPDVRELVEFRHHNLVTEPVPLPPDEPADLILCRNVTIYFQRETTRALMSRLHSCLRDGGYLFLGHSETLWQVSADFRLAALGSGDTSAFVYRRLDGPRQDLRSVLPDRRTLDEGPRPDVGERRLRPRRAAPAKPRRATPPPVRESRQTRDPLARARLALAEGRYDDAARLAASGDQLAPDAHYIRGVALANSGADQEALVALRKAVYLDPDSGLAHFLLAGVLARLGDRPAATREYRAAATTLGRRPTDEGAPELGGRTVRELAELCAQLGRPDEEARSEGTL